MDMYDFLVSIGLSEYLAVKMCMFSQAYNLDLEEMLTLMCNDAFCTYDVPERDFDYVKLCVAMYKSAENKSDKKADDDYIFA